jgi:hypothetical protein
MDNSFYSLKFFSIFLILSTISLIINIIFYIYKKKGYALSKIKKLIYIILVILISYLIISLPFFIITDSEVMMNSFSGYLILIILYNLSVFLLFISLIVFSMTLLEANEILINLGRPSFSDTKKGLIRIGNVLKGNKKKNAFHLSINDLEKHMFICGATGTGKSTFLQNFLIDFKNHYRIPFFLVEFKGEYHFLQNRIENVLILWPGINFSINIFNPEEADPIIHAERIFDILKSGKFLDESAEFSPQMEKVLVEILGSVCKNRKLQNWLGFERKCEEYLRSNQKEIPMLNQTLISIKNRIRRFSKGPLKALFDIDNEFEVKQLFTRDIVLDLSSIVRLGGEKEDALFFLNMILKYLWDKNISHGAYNFNGIKHITIVEDAQYFAPQDLTKKNKLTSYLEDIALLQRGTGECLITLATHPNISREILANLGVLVTFQNHIQKEKLCELLNLDEDYKHYLSILEQGQCIIRINSIKEPFLLEVPYIKRNSIEFSKIAIKNQEILNGTNNRIDSNKKIKTVKDESQIKAKLENFQDFSQGGLKRKFIFEKCAKLETLYGKNSFNELATECENTVNIILRKISLKLGYPYDGIGNFMKKLKELQIHEKFILYHDIIKLNRFIEILKSGNNHSISEIAKSMFIITRDLLKKVEIRQNKKKNNKYSENLRNNGKLNNFLITEDNKDKELEELKSVVNNLFNLQKKK